MWEVGCGDSRDHEDVVVVDHDTNQATSFEQSFQYCKVLLMFLLTINLPQKKTKHVHRCRERLTVLRTPTWYSVGDDLKSWSSAP